MHQMKDLIKTFRMIWQTKRSDHPLGKQKGLYESIRVSKILKFYFFRDFPEFDAEAKGFSPESTVTIA